MIKYFLFLLAILSCCNVISQSISEGERLLKADQVERAEIIFNDLYKKDKNNLKAKEFLGDIASKRKNWDKAVDIYEELLKEQPKNADYNFKYGGALGMKALTMSKLKAAFYINDIKLYLNRAAELDGKHVEARGALVKLYMQLPGILGGSEEASSKFAEELYEINKVDGYLARAFIAEETNKLKAAEMNYKAAVNSGKSPHTYEKLAIFYYEKLKNPSEAIVVYEKAFLAHKKNDYLKEIKSISAKYPEAKRAGLVFIQKFLQDNKGNSDALIMKRIIEN